MSTALLLTIVGATLSFLAATFGAFKEKHDPTAKDARRKLIFKWIAIGIFIASFVTTFVTSIDSERGKAVSNAQITSLNKSITTLQDINKIQHQQDLDELRKVNAQLSDLKTDVATVDLRKRMGALQGELDKYLNANPKIELQSGIWTSQQAPLTSELYIPVEGTHARFDIGLRNGTSTYAKNIEMWLNICTDCGFLSEPKDSQMLAADGPKMRYWREINLAPHIGYNSAIELDVPRQFTEMRLVLRYACENCLQTTDKMLTLKLGRTGLPFLQSPAKKIPRKPARKP